MCSHVFERWTINNQTSLIVMFSLLNVCVRATRFDLSASTSHDTQEILYDCTSGDIVDDPYLDTEISVF